MKTKLFLPRLNNECRLAVALFSLAILLINWSCKHCIECYTTVGGVKGYADKICDKKAIIDTSRIRFEDDCRELIAIGSVDTCGCDSE